MARSSIGQGLQSLELERWVRFPYGLLTIAKWWNLADTRRSERRAPQAWEFDSPLGDSLCRRAGARLALIRPDGPDRYRGLQISGQ